MRTQSIDTFYIVGLSVQTSNAQSSKDIPALWSRFLSDPTELPNRVGKEIYCAYTEYEGDHTQPYTVVLGHRVSNLEAVPTGFKGITVNKGQYEKFVAKGNLNQGAVWEAWSRIWSADLNRAYGADFEVYGSKAEDFENAEVEIFVGVTQ